MSAITVLDKVNVPTGPFTREQIADKLKTGEISLDDLAFVEGLTQWTPLRDILAKVDTPPMSSIPPPITSSPARIAPPAYSYAATMQPPTHLVYAGFWIRVAAHLLDNLFVTIPFIIIWFLFIMAAVGASTFAPLLQNHSTQLNPAIAASLFGTLILCYLSLILGRFLLVWLYHALSESGPHQATWGKRICGIRVTSLTGQRLTFGHASGRYFSTIITNMTMFIGYLMVAFTERKQTLHDMIASTLVVKD